MSAVDWLDVVGTLLLGSGILLAGGRRLEASVRLIAFQGVLAALATALAGLATGERELAGIALLVLALKGVAVPFFFFSIIMKIGARAQSDPAVNPAWSLIAAGALALVAYRAAARLSAGGGLALVLLPEALALLMIGLYLMISRRTALMQVVGLLVLENGLFLTGLGLTEGMPLPVELGISFDVVVAAIILGVLLHRINETFDSIDVDRLRTLKG